MRATDVLLHPVRLRIAQAFLGGRTLTTGDLRVELPDVAAATLYRQVTALVDGGVLEVAEERRVRGAVERTYRLRAGAASVDADEAATMTVEEHRRAFLTFVAGLLGGFDRYLDGEGEEPPDLGRDGVGYRQRALYLTDDELRELLADLTAVLAPRIAHAPGEGRTRRLFSTVLVPAEPRGAGRAGVDGRATDGPATDGPATDRPR
ncbi:helix-turn-helix domain-containing protein [uncultured Cellulomonas sp.]|uniref:helix-turn-helix domain-containing protein n=1 Tax=uncultured Cellulomonas sp. TaxID=189682 RepID=UPI00261FF649|nr:helix-turn-helix domain-containing protein [uncultured Cellulomonas sp.]